MFDIDRVLAAVAAKQHSVITLADVKAAGGNKDHANARVAAGRWKKVHRGVYRLAGAPWTWEGKVFAAVMACGAGAVASHQCAARLHGMGFASASPEVSVPRGNASSPKGVIVHECRDLHRCETVMRDSIPTTDAARTALDVARYIEGTNLRNIIEEGRRLELFDWHELLLCVATHARQGRAGIVRLREATVAGLVNDGITDTDSELIAVCLIRERGLPEPTLQHEIRAENGRIVASMDIAYVDQKTNFEIDGPVHLKPEVRAKDDARDHELRVVYGWTVRRIWWRIPIDHPREFLRIVRETLRIGAN